MHAAEHDDVGLGVPGGLGQLQGVTDEVGEILDLGLLVVVGQDDGVALLAQPLDRVEQRVALGDVGRLVSQQHGVPPGKATT